MNPHEVGKCVRRSQSLVVHFFARWRSIDVFNKLENRPRRAWRAGTAEHVSFVAGREFARLNESSQAGDSRSSVRNPEVDGGRPAEPSPCATPGDRDRLAGRAALGTRHPGPARSPRPPRTVGPTRVRLGPGQRGDHDERREFFRVGPFRVVDGRGRRSAGVAVPSRPGHGTYIAGQPL